MRETNPNSVEAYDREHALRRDNPNLARELGRYPVTLKKGAPDVDSEPYPIYGTEEEQEAWCIHHQDDVWGWAFTGDNTNE